MMGKKERHAGSIHSRLNRRVSPTRSLLSTVRCFGTCEITPQEWEVECNRPSQDIRPTWHRSGKGETSMAEKRLKRDVG